MQHTTIADLVYNFVTFQIRERRHNRNVQFVCEVFRPQSKSLNAMRTKTVSTILTIGLRVVDGSEWTTRLLYVS